MLGPLLGGAGLQFLSEYLRTHFTDYHTLVFGVITIVAVVLLPESLVRFGRETLHQRRPPVLSNLRRYRP